MGLRLMLTWVFAVSLSHPYMTGNLSNQPVDVPSLRNQSALGELGQEHVCEQREALS